MPSITEATETVETVPEISWQTFERECAVRPSLDVVPSPKRSRFATFLQALRLSSRRETRSHHSQPTELRSVDMLARDYPYLFIRLVCS